MSECYYKTLGVSKQSSQVEIKQAYKQLALKHHPDKNEDKQTSKVMFTKITEAYTGKKIIYTVLNDAGKRERYDKYGKEGVEETGMEDFQAFMSMGGFQGFQEFLQEFLQFDELAEMDKMFSKMMKGNGGKKKKGSKRAKGGPSMSMFNNMLEQMLKLSELEQILKSSENLQDLDFQEEDEQELTEEQLLILQFGKQNIQKKKMKKKKRINCKFDGQKIQEEDILMHFSEHHRKQFQEWMENMKSDKVEKNEKVETQIKLQKN